MFDVISRLPDVNKFGDGNMCDVFIITEHGLTGSTIYGTSGAPGEQMDFSIKIKSRDGYINLSDGDKVMAWRYKNTEQ